jgi:phosphoglycolate phosphatase
MTAAEQKYIVWDWNGTLINDLALGLHCFNITMRHFKKPEVVLEQYQKTFEYPFKRHYCKNGFSEEEFDQNVDIIQHVFHDAYDAGVLDIGFRDGVTDILTSTIKFDVHHIILSNHHTPSINAHLDRLNARYYFKDVLAHSNREAQSGWLPKSEHLKQFMQNNHLNPTKTCIVGDTPEESHIGRELGIASILITGGFATPERLQEARPDYLVHTLSDLNPIIHERGLLS